MKGKIIIECNDEGTHVEVHLEGCREHDPIFLVHSLGKSLGLASEDYLILSIAEAEGVLDSEDDQEVVYES